MIPEYWLCEAERCDNGEIIRGYFVPISDTRIAITDEYLRYGGTFIPQHRQIGNAYIAWTEIKPETLRRVAVKPILKSGRMHCVNCDASDGLDHFCPKCGMALDWSNQ